MTTQRVVYVDFDGVINSYKTPFNGFELPDPPVPGALAWLTELVSNFRVFIFSTRLIEPGAEHAIIMWLYKHGLPVETIDQLGFTALKRGAHVYIDDRAIPYRGGNHPSVKEIESFRPWTKK